MSRKPKSNLIISLEELQWITRTVERRNNEAAQATMTARQKEMVRGLAKKVEECVANLPQRPSDPIVFNASRGEARYIQGIAKELTRVIEDKIVPGYEQRGDKDRVRVAKEQVAMLKNLVAKIERTL